MENKLNELNIGDTIQYTAILYKKNEKIETSFIGNITSKRYHYDVGDVGIYVAPLYVLYCGEWYKTVFQPPTNKYFLYPHLLIKPCTREYYLPLYFLDTITTISAIVSSKTIDLDEFYRVNL